MLAYINNIYQLFVKWNQLQLRYVQEMLLDVSNKFPDIRVRVAEKWYTTDGSTKDENCEQRKSTEITIIFEIRT